MRWYLCVDIGGCGANGHVCILCVCGVDGLVEEGFRNFQKFPEVNVVIVVGREGVVLLMD